MKEYTIILTFGKDSVLVDVDTGYHMKSSSKAHAEKLAKKAIEKACNDLSYQYFPIDYDVYEYMHPEDADKEKEAHNLVKYKRYPNPHFEFDENWLNASPNLFVNPRIVSLSAMAGVDFFSRREMSEAAFFESYIARYAEIKVEDFSFVPMWFRIEQIM